MGSVILSQPWLYVGLFLPLCPGIHCWLILLLVCLFLLFGSMCDGVVPIWMLWVRQFGACCFGWVLALGLWCWAGSVVDAVIWFDMLWGDSFLRWVWLDVGSCCLE